MRHGIADDDITQQSYLLSEVEERQLVRNGIVAYAVANLIVQVVHEPALLDGQYLVEGSCDVESNGRNVLVQTVVLQLETGQPALVGTAKVELVAVFLCLDTAQDGMEFRQLHFADTRQLVVHLLLLHLQLFLVRKLLPLATATDAKMLAERLGTQMTIGDIPDDLSLHETMFLATNLQVANITRNSPGNKDYHVVDASYGLAFSGKISDGDIL